MVPDQYAAQRARVRHTLERLPDLAASDTPLLVLAHVLCPHPPFVFAADGSRPALPIPPENFFTDGVFTRSREEYAAGYGAQLAFLNARLEAAIDRILREARRPTIIVLQGDHGPGAGWAPNDVGATDLRERFAILNAYRFPDGDQPRLHPDITPVNTFRVILNRVGGADLPLLEDRSFYATWKEPYAFVDVTARVTGR